MNNTTASPSTSAPSAPTTSNICVRCSVRPKSARGDATWVRDACVVCRRRVRKSAYKARRRDPGLIKLTKRLCRALRGKSISLREAVLAGNRGGCAAGKDMIVTLLDEFVRDGLLVEADGRYRFHDALVRSPPPIGATAVVRRDETIDVSGRGVAPAEELGVAPWPVSVDAPLHESGGNHGDKPLVAAGGTLLDRHFPEGKTRSTLPDPKCSDTLTPTALGLASQILGRIRPILVAAARADREAILLWVTLTAPAWNPKIVRYAGTAFATRIERAGGSVLLALDVTPDGAPHWHGLVLSRASMVRRKEAHAYVKSAWVRETGAHRNGLRVQAVSAWAAFVTSGRDFAATAANKSFADNLAHLVHYMLKPWPSEHGERDEGADVVADGAFATLVT